MAQQRGIPLLHNNRSEKESCNIMLLVAMALQGQSKIGLNNPHAALDTFVLTRGSSEG